MTNFNQLETFMVSLAVAEEAGVITNDELNDRFVDACIAAGVTVEEYQEAVA